MAAKRGKSQARRNNGNSAGLPGWAWLVLGVVLTIGVVLVAPKYLKTGDGDGFFRPRPIPMRNRQPTSDSDDESTPATPTTTRQPPAPATKSDATPKPTQYDFYTLLPGEEVAMSRRRTRRDRARGSRAQSAARNRAAQRQTPPRRQPAADVDQQQTTPLATAAVGHAATATATTAQPTHALHPAGRCLRCIRRRRGGQGQDRAAGPGRTRGIGADQRQDRLPRAHGAVWHRLANSPKPSANSPAAACRRWRSRRSKPVGARRGASRTPETPFARYWRCPEEFLPCRSKPH